MKRAFDVGAAAIALLILFPLMALVMLAIKLDSKGPVFFRQWRVGRHYLPFQIYKFRTMQVGSGGGAEITAAGDPRITSIGRLLRSTKLDELPQLLNILRGDMSVVGPRPEVLQYVELFHFDYADVLAVRPGLTDLASIKYRDEAGTLAAAADSEHEYVTRILPDKIALAREYVRRSSVWFDMQLIATTIHRLFAGHVRTEQPARLP
jgi:lipopolysaccharide/colanic/teichoic acid biosynthesis glycosyltransferase